MAVGTVTVTEETYGTLKKITFAWTSGTGADAGTASGATTGAYTGALERLVTVPAAGGDAPDDNYDLTLTDEDSVDALVAAGANRHTSTTQQVLGTSLGIVANDKLTLNVTNAGEGNKGTVYVYLR